MITTRAPSRAIIKAVALPKPPAPAVMTATLSLWIMSTSSLQRIPRDTAARRAALRLTLTELPYG